MDLNTSEALDRINVSLVELRTVLHDGLAVKDDVRILAEGMAHISAKLDGRQ